MSRRLVLFDIDGTLLSAGGVSARTFGAAFLEVFGTVGDADRYDYSGKTDPQIVRELMKTSAERLAEADPDVLLPDLSDTRASLAAILGGADSRA